MADANSAETILPLLLGRYRIEGMLGEGGLGTVVKAFDTRLKRHVAIKTLKASLAADVDLYRRMKERFVREAEAGSRMGGNPHIVTVHDLATDSDGTLYLVQEFVPGGSVADRIARGSLPVAEALAIAADAAKGLQASHEKGIVHRDVKPANLFLAEDGRALVGDFGIAQVDDVSARTHATTGHPGTPLYMSPEQQQQSMYVRPASDQYSLGLVLFEMLTGVGYKRVGERRATAFLAAQPAPVAALAGKMIAEHPDDRYQSMAAVVEELRRVERHLANQPTIHSVSLNQLPGSKASSPPISTHVIDNWAEDASTMPPIIPTRLLTPRVDLQPSKAGSFDAHQGRAVLPVSRQPPSGISRRAILIGGGGLVFLGTAGGAAALSQRSAKSATPTRAPSTASSSSIASLTTQPPPLPTTALPLGVGAPSMIVGVTAKDFAITMDTSVVQAGTVTFHIRNDGPSPHNVAIKELNMASDTFDPGKGGDFKVDLKEGIYSVICNIPGHEQLGMHGTLTVGPTPKLLSTQTPRTVYGPGFGPEVSVRTKDFAITMDASVVQPGTVTFHVKNDGPSPHNIGIKELNKFSDIFDAGKSGDFKIDLPGGPFTVICNIPGHEQLGMKTFLNVM